MSTKSDRAAKGELAALAEEIKNVKTSDKCRRCKVTIPELPAADAYCVRCRYRTKGEANIGNCDDQ